MKAVNKASEQYALHHQEVKTVVHTEGGGHSDDSPDYIFVKADKKLIRVKFSEILYIEGLKDYVIIRTETGRVISLQTMKSLEDKLPISKFVRVHRSYIVGMDKIHAIVGNMVEVMEKGQAKHLPIGKNYRDELLEMIERHKL
jgi:DNA-binding LytR/AlgR family response regulator